MCGESDTLDEIRKAMMGAVRNVSKAHKLASKYGNDDIELLTNCAWMSLWFYYNRVVDFVERGEGSDDV